MAFSSTELLQFDELIDLIAGYAGSAAGKELVAELTPHSDLPRSKRIWPTPAKPSFISAKPQPFPCASTASPPSRLPNASLK